MNYFKEQRNAEIFEKYLDAPKHLKGRTILKIIDETGLSRSQVYSIIKLEKTKKNHAVKK